MIDKVRHRVEHAGATSEVDVFGGVNDGLVVAEVELPNEDAVVDLPDWIGDEVTDDPRYFNANLIKHPFREWGCGVVERPDRRLTRSGTFSTLGNRLPSLVRSR